jgi:hypothetical protein
MHDTRFDALLPTAAGRVGRRDAIKALVGAGLGLALTSTGWDRTSSLLTGPPAAAAAERQAGICDPPPTSSSFLPNDGRLAETFVATTSGKLSRIQLVVVKEANTTGDFLVRLLAVNASGTPTNKVLAKANIRDADVPVGSAVNVNAHFKKRTTAALKAGKHYAVAVSRPGPNGVGVRSAGNGCIDGRMFHSDTQKAPFAEVPGSDMLVAVFVGF